MKDSGETLTWPQQVWLNLSYPGVILLLLYILFGAAGNALVLFVYGKDKKLTGRIYIVCLAVIDLFACLVVLPQLPVSAVADQFPSLRIFEMVYAIQAVVLVQSYLFAQTAMALDQFVAVYYPFKHRRLSRKIKRVTLVVAVIVIVYYIIHSIASRTSNFIDNLPVPRSYIVLIFFLPMVVGFMLLLVVYPLIVLKLYKQHRHVRPKAAQPGMNHVSNKCVALTLECDRRKVMSWEAETSMIARQSHRAVPVSRDPDDKVTASRDPDDKSPASRDPDHKASSSHDPDGKVPASYDSDVKPPASRDPEGGMPSLSIVKSWVHASPESLRNLAASPKPLTGLTATLEPLRGLSASPEALIELEASSEAQRGPSATPESLRNPAASPEALIELEASSEALRRLSATAEPLRNPAASPDAQIELAATREALTGPSASRETSGRAPVEAAGAVKMISSHEKKQNIQPTTVRRMHVQAVKVYSAIFLLFSLSLVAVAIYLWARIPLVSYLYYLSHAGNPIIYYVFVPNFRARVNAYVSRVKCWRM